jgi:hypothetical protein
MDNQQLREHYEKTSNIMDVQTRSGIYFIVVKTKPIV